MQKCFPRQFLHPKAVIRDRPQRKTINFIMQQKREYPGENGGLEGQYWEKMF
jgi:hypothetical protein